MAIQRREFTLMAMAAAITPAWASTPRPIQLVLAPSNLGLRPEGSREPGTWRAPQVLAEAGLAEALHAAKVVTLERPSYETAAQAGTRIRNGSTIRAFSLQLARTVRDVLQAGGFPVVIGGDCSVLLGGLYGLRLAGGRGLVHVDGHSDFYHPGNYDTSSRLGSVAGMDLALASGRGEALLTEWPEIGKPLARDIDILQVGEREESSGRDHIPDTQIEQITVQRVLKEGIDPTSKRAIAWLQRNELQRAWLHVDLDVLDERVMPAVDSPGRPGLNYAQLSSFVRALCGSGRIAGAHFGIYDPNRDRSAQYAKPLVRCIAEGIGGLHDADL
jgi:arginase